MVPINHASVHVFQHMYFAIITYYLGVVKSFTIVTVSPILHVCAKFGTFFP